MSAIQPSKTPSDPQSIKHSAELSAHLAAIQPTQYAAFLAPFCGAYRNQTTNVSSYQSAIS